MNMPAKPEPGIDTNGQLKSVAMALDSIVLPVPGAPSISRPRSRLPPARSKASPDCHSVTTRRTSSLASAWPRTSASLTPQSASPGSYELIWLTAIIRNGPKKSRKLIGRNSATCSSVVSACDPSTAITNQRQRADDHDPPDRASPEPGAAPVDHVDLALLLVGAQQAGPRNEPPQHQIERRPEQRDLPDGGQKAHRHRPVLGFPEPDVGDGAGQHRDERRRPLEPSPLADGGIGGRFRRSVAGLDLGRHGQQSSSGCSEPSPRCFGRKDDNLEGA